MTRHHTNPDSASFANTQFNHWQIRLGALLLFALATSSVVSAASGEFDSSFGQVGIVRLSADASLPTDAQATSVTTDSAGRLLVTGFGNQSRGGVFARIFATGALDTGLAGKGFVLRPRESPYEFREPRQALALSDGSMLLIEKVRNICFGSGGGCSLFDRSMHLSTKMREDGSVDVTYGGGEASLGPASTSISLEPDGSLTVIGVQSYLVARSMTLARYDPLGQRNLLFNQDAVTAAINCGPAYTTVPDNMLTARHTGNRLLVAQQLTNVLTQNKDVCVTRLNQDGTRDTTFGSGGQTVISDNSLAAHTPFKFLVRSDGGIDLLLLNGAPKTIHRPAIVWLTANGALDTSRGSQGITNPVVGAINSITAAALQADDKILLVGYGGLAGNPVAVDESRPVIARQDARGTIDFSFGPVRGGYANLVSGVTRLAPTDVISTADGGSYVAGGAGNVDLTVPTVMAVAKLQGDPVPVSQATNNGGGGGCGYTRGGPLDPTLPVIAILAAACLLGRRVFPRFVAIK